MFGLIALAFIVIPIVEIYLIIQVGSALGGWETIGLLILISVVGAWLVRREGFSILARLNRALSGGETPTNPIIEGLLVLFAGALMLTPGFLTDAVGLLLLFPPTRVLVRGALKRRFAHRVQVGGGAFGARFGGMGATNVVWDTDGNVVHPRDDDPPDAIELGPTDDR